MSRLLASEKNAREILKSTVCNHRKRDGSPFAERMVKLAVC